MPQTESISIAMLAEFPLEQFPQPIRMAVGDTG